MQLVNAVKRVRLTFRSRLLLITLLPLLVVSGLSWLVISFQADRLARAELTTLETRILEARKAEIRNYIALAQTSIRHIYESEPDGRAAAQARVKQILNDMTFGDDGYFFVYDMTGTNLVHPRLPELIGRNWWDLQDIKGDYVIRNLIDQARNGGGFHRYVWDKPTTGQPAAKLGYAGILPKWGWMFGTGLYLDDIANEIAVLRARTEENVDQTAVILFAITFVALLLASLLLFAIRLSEERFADSRLTELTRRILCIQEDERKRVSTELHDGISQLLVGTRYSLDLAHAHAPDKGRARGLIAKSMDILENAIIEVRRISKDLRPSVLDDLGLAAATQSLCKDFGEQTGLQVHVNATPVGECLSDGAKTALYRVLQESLTNVARHAEATLARVELARRNSDLVLSICDNGIGMPALHGQLGTGGIASPEPTSGLGIRNMIERVESHGGRLILRPAVFDSKIGGTEIHITLPLHDFTGETPEPARQPQMQEAAEAI